MGGQRITKQQAKQSIAVGHVCGSMSDITSVPLSSVPDITYHVCVKECNVAQYLPCVDSQLRAFVSNIPYRAVSTTHRVFARFMRLGVLP
ncbi:hypothetical protein EVAR_99923_1 [Eumeta japonica]|uniref:Uncharacterized protein n=1 Tax=Eumeta variegata TaxID=151549 RepID=A0A4C1YXL2_EUMVA|nr:hypothetical protein EVAR_99923_1 [Eumeta japonica]